MLPTDELIRKATTTTTNLQALIPQLWAAQIEKNLRKQACLQQSVIENSDLLVPHGGDTVYIPTLPDLAAAVALTEGTDMAVNALNNASSVALKPVEYGLAIEASRKALDRIKYDGVSEIIDRLTYSMTLSLENSVANLTNASVPGTSNKMTQVYANSKTSANIAAADTFNDAMIWQGVNLMKQGNNVPFEDGYFRLYISPNQWSALMQDQNVRQDLRYAAPERILNGEMGVIHGCRVIVTNYVLQTMEGVSSLVPVSNALLLSPRWGVIAWKRRPGVVVDPTLYDMGRRRRFGVLADFDTELLHNERAFVLKSA